MARLSATLLLAASGYCATLQDQVKDDVLQVSSGNYVKRDVLTELSLPSILPGLHPEIVQRARCVPGTSVPGCRSYDIKKAPTFPKLAVDKVGMGPAVMMHDVYKQRSMKIQPPESPIPPFHMMYRKRDLSSVSEPQSDLAEIQPEIVQRARCVENRYMPGCKSYDIGQTPNYPGPASHHKRTPVMKKNDGSMFPSMKRPPPRKAAPGAHPSYLRRDVSSAPETQSNLPELEPEIVQRPQCVKDRYIPGCMDYNIGFLPKFPRPASHPERTPVTTKDYMHIEFRMGPKPIMGHLLAVRGAPGAHPSYLRRDVSSAPEPQSNLPGFEPETVQRARCVRGANVPGCMSYDLGNTPTLSWMNFKQVPAERPRGSHDTVYPDPAVSRPAWSAPQNPAMAPGPRSRSGGAVPNMAKPNMAMAMYNDHDDPFQRSMGMYK